MTEVQFYVLALAVILLATAVTIVGRKVVRLENSLRQVRMATYEITQALDGDIKDLRTSLANADIPIATEQRDERIRRFKLTPEERERESKERWDAVVAQVEDQWG